MVVVRPFQDGLVMHQLRYPDEIKVWDEVPVPKAGKVKEAELILARQLIAQIATDTFDPGKYEDTVKARVKAAIDRKREGGELIEEVEEAPRTKVVDLMEALKASLGAPRKASHAHASEKPARKRPERARSPRRASTRTHRAAHR